MEGPEHDDARPQGVCHSSILVLIRRAVWGIKTWTGAERDDADRQARKWLGIAAVDDNTEATRRLQVPRVD